MDGYAEGVQEVVHGYQAKVAGLGQATKPRHAGGRGGGKRGGKVRSPPRRPCRLLALAFSCHVWAACAYLRAWTADLAAAISMASRCMDHMEHQEPRRVIYA